MRTSRIALPMLAGILSSLLAFAPPRQASANAANNILEAALPNEPVTLDPSENTAGIEEVPYLYLIYDLLIDFDPKTLELRPGLASSWEWSADKLALTLHLRHGVTFQDGTAFDGNAVKVSLQHFQKSKRNRDLDVVTSIDVPDPYTVLLHVATPNSMLPAVLADRGGMIVSPTALAKNNDSLAATPVGAGPFKLTNWARGNQLQFQAYDGYWNKAAVKLAGINVKVIGNSTSMVAALESGQIDYAAPVDTVNLPVLRKNAKLKTSLQKTIAYAIANINTGLAPTDNKLVRQAMNYAIDRKKIAAAVYGPGINAEPSSTPSPAEYWTGTPALANAFTYNPAKAKELLKQAGYPNGVTVTYCAADTGGLTPGKLVTDIITDEMKNAGITLQVEMRANTAACIDLFSIKKSINSFLASWSGRPNPWQTYQLQLGHDAAFNVAKTTYPGVDALLQKVLETPDPKDQKPLFDQLNQAWVDYAPELTLYFYVNLEVSSVKLGGQQEIPLLRPYMRNLYYKK